MRETGRRAVVRHDVTTFSYTTLLLCLASSAAALLAGAPAGAGLVVR